MLDWGWGGTRAWARGHLRLVRPVLQHDRLAVLVDDCEVERVLHERR